jgi:hypothetical protein
MFPEVHTVLVNGGYDLARCLALQPSTQYSASIQWLVADDGWGTVDDSS